MVHSSDNILTSIIRYSVISLNFMYLNGYNTIHFYSIIYWVLILSTCISVNYMSFSIPLSTLPVRNFIYDDLLFHRYILFLFKLGMECGVDFKSDVV